MKQTFQKEEKDFEIDICKLFFEITIYLCEEYLLFSFYALADGDAQKAQQRIYIFMLWQPHISACKLLFVQMRCQSMSLAASLLYPQR